MDLDEWNIESRRHVNGGLPLGLGVGRAATDRREYAALSQLLAQHDSQERRIDATRIAKENRGETANEGAERLHGPNSTPAIVLIQGQFARLNRILRQDGTG